MSDHEIDPTRVPHDPDAAEEAPDGVQQLHRRVIQEEIEPRDGFEPIPVWLLLVFGALLMWGGYYVGVNSGDFRADVYDRADPPIVAPPHPEGKR